MKPEMTPEGIRIGDRTITLTPRQRAVAEVLTNDFNNVVHYDKIRRTAFAKSGASRMQDAVQKTVSLLRRSLKGTGLKVRNVRDEGYRMQYYG